MKQFFKRLIKEIMSEDGTAATELLILAPVYGMLLLATIGFGYLSTGIVKTPQAARYIAFTDGNQQANSVSGPFFGALHGEVTVSDTITDGSHTAQDFDMTLQEVAFGSVGGHYELRGGTLVFVANHTPNSMADYIERVLRPLCDETEAITRDFHNRSESSVTFKFNPVFSAIDYKVNASSKIGTMIRGSKNRVGPAGPSIQSELLPLFGNYENWDNFMTNQSMWESSGP